MQPEARQKTITALKKASGSLQKIQEMVEQNAYCIDILQQLNAVMGLLRGVNARVVENHLQTCGHEKMSAKTPKVREEFVSELLKALDLSSRK